MDSGCALQGIDFDDGRAPFWMFHEKKNISTGAYSTSIQQETFKYRVRVEADGYLPVESRLIKPNDPDNNRIITDIDLAPKDKGRVHYVANFQIVTNRITRPQTAPVSRPFPRKKSVVIRVILG